MTDLTFGDGVFKVKVRPTPAAVRFVWPVKGPVPWFPPSAWSSIVAYVAGPPASLVTFNGSSYVALVNNTGVTPGTDPLTWALIAQKGAGGGGSSDIAPVLFSFGDATPSVVYTATVNGILDLAALLIETPFNGVSPSLRLDVGAAPVMSTNENDPKVATQYTASPNLTMTAGQAVTLTVVPGTGCTQGSGYVILRFLPL